MQCLYPVVSSYSHHSATRQMLCFQKEVPGNCLHPAAAEEINDGGSSVLFLPVFREMDVDAEVSLFSLLVSERADERIRTLSLPDLQEMSAARLRRKLGGP